MSEIVSTLEPLKEQFQHSENKRSRFDFGIVKTETPEIKKKGKHRVDFGILKKNNFGNQKHVRNRFDFRIVRQTTSNTKNMSETVSTLESLKKQFRKSKQ